METYGCDRCSQHGVNYCRTYKPADFIEGDPASPIWIIGLNPAMPMAWRDGRTTSELQDLFSTIVESHGYFRDFRTVWPWLFDRLGRQGGVAHTDLVKCSSESWPPDGVSGRNAAAIVSNCSSYLCEQIERHKPRLLICNGSAVCEFIRDLVKPSDLTSSATSYVGALNGHEIVVVMSGFIGRIDNYAKRRLGREVEEKARSLNLVD